MRQTGDYEVGEEIGLATETHEVAHAQGPQERAFFQFWRRSAEEAKVGKNVAAAAAAEAEPERH